ncbi:hypothetical protein [Streptomyces misionensis]|uniref:hypothetical protein n=1 Tax=Streptomyces misionensis TaxID=67331 RepID=UPI00396C2696
MSPQPTTMLDGDTVYRIVWVPGTDRLRGHPGPGTAPAPDPAPRPHRLVGA